MSWPQWIPGKERRANRKALSRTADVHQHPKMTGLQITSFILLWTQGKSLHLFEASQKSRKPDWDALYKSFLNIASFFLFYFLVKKVKQVPLQGIWKADFVFVAASGNTETDTFIADLSHLQCTEVNCLWNEEVTHCPRTSLVTVAASKPLCHFPWKSKCPSCRSLAAWLNIVIIKYNCKLGRESAPSGDSDYSDQAVLYPSSLQCTHFQKWKCCLC